MNPKIAIKIMFGILAAVMLFHLCIIIKVIPYDITWGGRLKNDAEMYVFEFISLAINSFLILILMIKGEYMKAIIPLKAVNIILWIFVGIFCLNTIGNILATTDFEKYFTILTAVSAFLLWVILTKKDKS